MDKYLFTSREYLYMGYGGKRIDEEAFFWNYSDAYEYAMQNYAEENPSEGMLRDFRIGIDKFDLEINDGDSSESWVFDIKGELLRHYREDTLVYPERGAFTNKYSCGDIVFVYPNIDYQFSPFCEPTYGVIGEVPGAQRQADSCDPFDIGNDYILYFVSEKCIVSHVHIEEGAIQCVASSVPKNLTILTVLSRHFSGTRILDQKVLESLLSDFVFVHNMDSFDFKELCIKQAIESGYE